MLLTANILQPLINVFEAVLKFFHNNLGVGWGLSIVLLTVVIRAFLVPLTVKQFRSMQALQAHQPELKALQTKYKDDKQRLNQEIMKFYKENHVNPLGSCLPLLAQFPVFISLYYLLRKDLRGYICPHIQSVYQAAHGAGATTPCGVGHGAQLQADESRQGQPHRHRWQRGTAPAPQHPDRQKRAEKGNAVNQVSRVLDRLHGQKQQMNYG